MPFGAFADPTVDSFVDEVLARNPGLVGAAQRRSAYANEAQAALYWSDPTLTVMADYLPKGDEKSPMPMLRYQLTQTLPWPGKLGAMRDASEQAANGAGASLDVRKLDLALDARRSFFMLIFNGQERAINRAQRALSNTIASAALGRYGAGMGSHHEVARTEVEVQMLDYELVALEADRTSMIAMLDALRNVPPNVPIAEPTAPTWTPITTLDVTQSTAAALMQRPELRGMTAMREEARAMARLARREPYPDVMVGGWFNQMIDGAAPSMGGMIGITLPVFSGPRAHYRAVAFDDRASAADRDADGMRAMVRAEVAGAIARFDAASKQVDVMTGVVLPKTRESFDASLAGYGAGTADIVGLLEARRSLQRAELELARSRVMREIAFAEVQRATGAQR